MPPYSLMFVCLGILKIILTVTTELFVNDWLLSFLCDITNTFSVFK